MSLRQIEIYVYNSAPRSFLQKWLIHAFSGSPVGVITSIPEAESSAAV